MSYLLVFAPLFLLHYHKYFMGWLHALDIVVIAALFVHVYRTKTVAVASVGLCAVAVSTITLLTIDGGAEVSGIYFVLPASIFIFFLTDRKRGVLWVMGMFLPLTAALVWSVIQGLALPYSHLNFLLFLFSYLLSIALLYLYANEKDKLDHRLRQSLKEISSLAESLEHEKASIEEKVQLRTRQYKEERAKLEASIDSLRLGFIILDHSLTVLSINEAGRRALTQPTESGGSLTVPETMTMSQIISRLGGAYDLVTQVKACMKQGHAISARDIPFGSHFLAIIITPVMDNQTVIGTVVLVEDITDSKALERSRDEFFSIASHELRTPLTSIMGNASMAQQYYDRIDKTELKDMLGDISASGKRLITIVNDFLDTSRLEQGKLVLRLEPVDAAAIAKGVVRDLSRMAADKHLKLSLKGGEAPALVMADDDRLKQIVTNLLNNAIKYTERGSVTMTLARVGKHIEIAVEDTGQGIPLESQHLLFRKFQQASNNILTRDNTQSTGLGLYIARMLTEAMKGKLYLKQSAEHQGSIFVLSLPAAKATK